MLEKTRCATLLGALFATQAAPGSVDVTLGGSLSLTAHYNDNSEDALRGLELLAETVTGSGNIFATPDGQDIKVNLDFRDDGGDADKVSTIYRDMLNGSSNIPKFLLGPASQHLSPYAEKTVQGIGGTIVLQRSTVTEDVSENIFSISGKAADMLLDVLYILRAQEVKTITIIWQNESFSRAACSDGVATHAEALGFTVLEIVMSYDGISTNLQMLQKMSLQSEASIVCGAPENEVITFIAMRSLTIYPKGIVSLHAAASSVADAIGAPNTNYMMTPTYYHWMHPTAGHSASKCRVFGSAERFDTAYYSKYGKHPGEAAALAVGAAITLLTAAEELLKKISYADFSALTPIQQAEESAEVLRNIVVPSFLGNLSFTAEGHRKGALASTVQVQALDEGPRWKRFIESGVALVNNDTQKPLWPSPAWEQKELEVFPCKPGHVPKSSAYEGGNIEAKEDDDFCKPCEAGRHRTKSSLDCHNCEPGQYSYVAGMERCITCPRGAYCNWNDTTNTASRSSPLAQEGFYRISPYGQPLYVECDPPSLCTGANNCRNHSTSTFCQGCQEGYTNRGSRRSTDRECTACPQLWQNAFAIVAIVVSYIIYILVIGSLTLASAGSIRAIHSIIIKKIINHSQMTNTVLIACSFSWISFVGGSPMGFAMRWSQDPIENFVNIDCMLEVFNGPINESSTETSDFLSQDEALCLIGLLMMPGVVLCMSFLLITAYCLRRHQAEKLKAIAGGIGISLTPPTFEPMDNQDGYREGEIGDSSRDSDGEDAADMMDRKESLQKQNKKMDKANDERLERLQYPFRTSLVLCVQWSIVTMFILHPLVVKMVLKLISCVSEEGDLTRLSTDPDVICDSAEHQAWYNRSYAGLIIYGFGIPALFYAVLFSQRDRLMDPTVREVLGFLYNGFEANMYHFEVVHMLRKTLILIAAQNISILRVRVTALLGLVFFFLAVHIRCLPYDNRDFMCLDRLEFASLFSIILMLVLRFFMDVRETVEETSPSTHQVVSTPLIPFTLAALAAFFQFFFWYVAFTSLFRNSVMKHIHQKAATYKEAEQEEATAEAEREGLDREAMAAAIKARKKRYKMSLVHRALLSLEPAMNSIKYDAEYGTVSTLELSQKEMHFLSVVLCDTLKFYVNAAVAANKDPKKAFHIMRVTASLHKAVTGCVTERAELANQFRELEAHKEHNPGIGALLRRWKHEVHLMLGHNAGTLAWRIGHKIKKETKKKFKKRHALARRIRKQLATEEHAFTVEELQVAFMRCWPEISQPDSEYLRKNYFSTHASKLPGIDGWPIPVVKADVEQMEEDENIDEWESPVANQGSRLGWLQDPLVRELVDGVGVSEIVLRMQTGQLEEELQELKKEAQRLQEDFDAMPEKSVDDVNSEMLLRVSHSEPLSALDTPLPALSPGPEPELGLEHDTRLELERIPEIQTNSQISQSHLQEARPGISQAPQNRLDEAAPAADIGHATSDPAVYRTEVAPAIESGRGANDFGVVEQFAYVAEQRLRSADRPAEAFQLRSAAARIIAVLQIRSGFDDMQNLEGFDEMVESAVQEIVELGEMLHGEGLFAEANGCRDLAARMVLVWQRPGLNLFGSTLECDA